LAVKISSILLFVGVLKANADTLGFPAGDAVIGARGTRAEGLRTAKAGRNRE
jgi:hypothetical protein